MRAQDFSLQDATGNPTTLAQFAGRPVILYFYPKDFTPGCTVEAEAFRDEFVQFEALGAVIVGVSKDSVASHAKFAQKHQLPFVLLSDPELEVTKAYGAFGEKKLYGKSTLGVKRTTVLVGSDGEVLKRWDNVKVKGHARQVLDELRGRLG